MCHLLKFRLIILQNYQNYLVTQTQSYQENLSFGMTCSLIGYICATPARKEA